MKKLWHILILVFCSMQLQAGAPTGSSRNLMMLLNWTDETLNDGEEFGALSEVTIAALEQKAAPVIVTAQTWRSIMGRGTNPSYPSYHISRQAFYGSNPSFRYSDWVVKKLSDYLYLFIPKNYIAAVKGKKDTCTQVLNTITPLTQEERELGMKISKFPDISQKDLFTVDYHKSYIDLANYKNHVRKSAFNDIQQLINTGNEDIAETYYFSQHVLYMLGKLLITRADVVSKIDPAVNPAQFKEETEKNEALLLQEWLVYVDGHGGTSSGDPVQPIIVNRPGYYPSPSNLGISAGLEHNTFQQLLKFFNGSVVTGGLLYATCFSGGPHLSVLFEKEWDAFLRNPKKQLKKDSYNYIILNTNMFYTSTASAVLGYVQFPAFFNALHAFVHYQPTIVKPQAGKFFAKKSKKAAGAAAPSLNVAQALANIVRLVSQFDLSRRWQVPAVRFPFTEWFVAIDDPSIPLLFEKSKNRFELNSQRIVQGKKNAALDALIKKKVGEQKQLKAGKKEQASIAAAEKRRLELEAQRLKEQKKKEQELYAGIMKLQQIQQNAQPTVVQPHVSTAPQQPAQQPGRPPVTVTPQPQPTARPPVAAPAMPKLNAALQNLYNALEQLAINLYYRFVAQQAQQQQPTYSQPTSQESDQESEEEEYEDEGSAEEENGQFDENGQFYVIDESNYQPQGDYGYYYYDSDDSYDSDEQSDDESDEEYD